MDSSKELQVKYYELITDLFEQRIWDTPQMDELLKEISSFLQLDYLALYIHAEKAAALRFVSAHSEHAALLPEKFITSEDIVLRDFFQDELPYKDFQFLPIMLNESQVMFLVFRSHQPLDEEMLSVFREETEKLLRIAERTWRKMRENKNNKLLLQISTKLLTSHDKSNVLREIMCALDEVYTDDYTCRLLLTQEYEEAAGLPVKVLEYHEEDPLSIRNRVFMTGELEIEVKREEHQETIYAPLIGEQSVYGVLEIQTPKESFLSQQEIEFAANFAALSGKALEKTILYEDSLVQVNNLRQLNDIIHRLNTTRGLSELTGLIRDEIKKITDAAEIGFICLNEQAAEVFNLLPGSTAAFRTEEGRKAVETYRSRVMDSNEAIFTGNAENLRHSTYQSVMAFPMANSGLRIGFTLILHEEPYHFTFETFKLMESFMQHSSLAISNTILRERLQTTVITDFLTELYTRRYLEEKVREHLETGNRGTLILLDIDDFKQVNDTYGHHIGDRVLKQAATVIEKEIGTKGVVARWGGEELAIYLPEQSKAEALEIADDIREKISSGTVPEVTVSGGVAEWKKTDNDSYEHVFLRADQALYRAKTGGKNRIFNH